MFKVVVSWLAGCCKAPPRQAGTQVARKEKQTLSKGRASCGGPHPHSHEGAAGTTYWQGLIDREKSATGKQAEDQEKVQRRVRKNPVGEPNPPADHGARIPAARGPRGRLKTRESQATAGHDPPINTQ